MKAPHSNHRLRVLACFGFMFIVLAIYAGVPRNAGQTVGADDAPTPLLKKGHPADWVFVFRLNSGVFAGCGGTAAIACPFGGTAKKYKSGQQYVFASSEHASLEQGRGCAGDSTDDPLVATFDEIYNGPAHYVIWNGQFYDDPKIAGCTTDCGAPWGAFERDARVECWDA